MVEVRENTLDKIMIEGKKEFLDKGFKDASLRNIVKNAGVTTGAFYGYFKDKESLFHALVLPAINRLKSEFLTMQHNFNQMPKKVQKDSMTEYSRENLKKFVSYIYEYYDSFQLLISGAEGTVYEDFLHTLVEVEVDYTIRFIESTDNPAISSGRITPELIHIIASAQFAGIFEIVIHNMAREEADVHIDRLKAFFDAGWNAILNPT